MRTLILLTLWVALWAGAGIPAGYAQGASDFDAGSKLMALENSWNQAAGVKDVRALAAILDDNFVYVNRNGNLLNKAGTLADIQATPRLQAISEGMSVHLHGNTVVTGIYRTQGLEHGKPFMRRERFMDTWRYENEVWTAIASLSTPIG